jgi:hypothetical protein
MAVTGAARMARRSGVLAWVLWVLVVLGLAAGFWLEVLLRRAGRSDPLDTAVAPTVATVSAATVGVVLAASMLDPVRVVMASPRSVRGSPSPKPAHRVSYLLLKKSW